MVGLLHAMAFMVLLLIGWVIWNNKPLPLPLPSIANPSELGGFQQQSKWTARFL